MIRTQLYIPEDMDRAIEAIARREKKPKAEVIRRVIKEGIKAEKPQTNAGDALLRLAELGKKLNLKCDDPNLSTNIDKYLYEEWDKE